MQPAKARYMEVGEGKGYTVTPPAPPLLLFAPCYQWLAPGPFPLRRCFRLQLGVKLGEQFPPLAIA